jgi:hypothetical protein
MSKNEKIEYVDFVISLPKEVVDFLEANKKSLDYASVEAYIELGVLQMVQRDIEGGEFGEHVKTLIAHILNGKDNDP